MLFLGFHVGKKIFQSQWISSIHFAGWIAESISIPFWKNAVLETFLGNAGIAVFVFFFHQRVVCFTTGRIWKILHVLKLKRHQKIEIRKILEKTIHQQTPWLWGGTKMPFLILQGWASPPPHGMHDFDKKFPREASHRHCGCHQMPRCGTRCWGRLG